MAATSRTNYLHIHHCVPDWLQQHPGMLVCTSSALDNYTKSSKILNRLEAIKKCAHCRILNQHVDVLFTNAITLIYLHSLSSSSKYGSLASLGLYEPCLAQK